MLDNAFFSKCVTRRQVGCTIRLKDLAARRLVGLLNNKRRMKVNSLNISIKNISKLKAFLFIAASAIVLGTTAVGYGMPPAMKGMPGGGPGPEGLGNFERLEKEIGLTPEQVEKLKALKEQGEALREKTMDLREELMDAGSAENPNENEIRQIATELGQAIGDGAVHRAKAKNEFLAMLTPEQTEKFEQLKENRKTKFESRRNSIVEKMNAFNPDEIVTQLSSRIQLTDEQASKVKSILAEDMARMKAAMENIEVEDRNSFRDMRKDFTKMHRDSKKRLSAVLEREQLVELGKIMHERRRDNMEDFRKGVPE